MGYKESEIVNSNYTVPATGEDGDVEFYTVGEDDYEVIQGMIEAFDGEGQNVINRYIKLCGRKVSPEQSLLIEVSDDGMEPN